VPLKQFSPEGQPIPQVPQLLLSFEKSAHPPALAHGL
jgi:hypothetical protein